MIVLAKQAHRAMHCGSVFVLDSCGPLRTCDDPTIRTPECSPAMISFKSHV